MTVLQVVHSQLHFSHTDGRGVAVSWQEGEGQVRVERTRVTSSDDIERKLAVGEGVVVRGGARLAVSQVRRILDTALELTVIGTV